MLAGTCKEEYNRVSSFSIPIPVNYQEIEKSIMAMLTIIKQLTFHVNSRS